MMANHNATGKKPKHGVELVQRIRANILGAFDCVEKDGKLISEILAESLKENPLKFMDMASKHLPKEIQTEVEETVKHYVINASPEPSTDEWMNQQSSGDLKEDRKLN